MFRILDDRILVAPQITPADVARAAGEGVTLIINNRPDEEEAGQPAGALIAAAAAAAAIDYVAIPVTHAGFSLPQIEAMADALGSTEGKVLAFCRSGTRSTLLWALASAAAGDDPDALARAAAGAGYDLASIRPVLDTLAARGDASDE